MNQKVAKYLFIVMALSVPVSIIITHIYELDNNMRGEAVSSMDSDLCEKIEASFIRSGCLEDVATRKRLKSECEKKHALDIGKCKSFYR